MQPSRTFCSGSPQIKRFSQPYRAGLLQPSASLHFLHSYYICRNYSYWAYGQSQYQSAHPLARCQPLLCLSDTLGLGEPTGYGVAGMSYTMGGLEASGGVSRTRNMAHCAEEQSKTPRACRWGATQRRCATAPRGLRNAQAVASPPYHRGYSHRLVVRHEADAMTNQSFLNGVEAEEVRVRLAWSSPQYRNTHNLVVAGEKLHLHLHLQLREPRRSEFWLARPSVGRTSVMSAV